MYFREMMKKLIVLSTLIIIIASSCEKYEEDKTFIHFKKPENRIKRKTKWRIVEYMINGADSIPNVNATKVYDQKLEVIEFHKSYKHLTSLDVYMGKVIRFELTYDKERLKIFYEPAYPLTYPIFADGLNEWEIKRLDKSVMAIELNKNANMYRIVFNRID